MHPFTRYFSYWSKEPIERKQLRRMKDCGVYFIVLFAFFFKIMQSEQRQIWSCYIFIFGRPKQKEWLARLARDRQRRYRSWLVKLDDQVERWRELCSCLDVCNRSKSVTWCFTRNRKLAKMLLDT